MAHQRAPLVAHDLEDIQVALSPIRDRQAPVEAPSAFPVALPDPTAARRPSVKPAQFPSVAKASAKDRLVSYSVRLKLSQIDRLEELKAERGIVPSELVRDFIDRCLPLV